MDNRDVNQIPDVVDGEDSDVIYAEDIEFGDDDIEFIEEFQDDDDEEEGEDYEDGMGDDDEEEGPIEDNSIARFAEHTDSVYCVVMLERPDNGDIIIVTGSGDETAKVWKIDKKAAESGTLRESAGAASSSSSPSSSSSDAADETHTSASIKSLHTITDHTDTISDVAFSHDSEFLATGGMDGKIGVWKIQGDNCTQHKMLDGPGEAIEWLHWNPRAHFLLAGSADTTCWLFNAKNGKCVNVFAGHSGSVSAGCFTSDGKFVLTGSEDGTVRFWSPSTGSTQHVFSGDLFSQGPITSVVSKPDDAQIFASTSLDGLVCVGHTGNGKVLHRLGVSNMDSEDNSVETADFCPTNTNLLATGSLDKKITIWDLNSAQARQTFSHDDCVIKVMFDKHSPLLYSCSADRTMRVWDYRTGEAVRVFRGHREAVLDFSVSQDGSFIVTGSDDFSALLFSAQS